MKQLLVSVLDLKAQYFSSPMTAKTDAEAVRLFTDAINQHDTSLHQHPEDYTLYKVAFFDTDTGEVTPVNPPLLLIAGTSVQLKG